MPRQSNSRVSAILGPTNTGKTYLAMERLAAHSSGVMGFPLRLLARENYDRLCAIKGEQQVALITGEQRIVPENARYFLCTAESMPLRGEREFAFAAVDEIQLAADPERGHIFTDRLLHARGREETMLLGSGAMAPVVRALLPDVDIDSRPRFSTLRFAGEKKLSRLPPRSAIVAFSVEEVYAVAEMLRRLRGGAAVVMGALSPATRNAQVEMFQSGEVDYLVATDAIGMGLNLDVNHIAFASLAKFDGRRRRRLTVQEMAQIAGRAGRHQRDGTFGTLAGLCKPFTEEEIEAIEDHRFPPVGKIFWRDAEPRTDNIENLIADLSRKPDDEALKAAPEAVDLKVLKELVRSEAVRSALGGRGQVARLWAAASLPDFRQLGADHHARFVEWLWQYLGHGAGRLPRAVTAQEIAKLDNMQGDIDTLSARISAVRIWSYITHRADWTEAHAEMAERAGALEARLSDALHERLKQRFVDRKGRLLKKKLADGDILPRVEVDQKGQLLVDDQPLGRVEGFRFVVASDARLAERKLLQAAALRFLGEIMENKAEFITAAADSEFSLRPDSERRPAIYCQEEPIARLSKGNSILTPGIDVSRTMVDASAENRKTVLDRLTLWMTAQQEKHLAGLAKLDALSKNADEPGEVRALASQLVDALGIVSRKDAAPQLRNIDREQRGAARKAGVVFGALDIYEHAMMKPGAVRWRQALASAWSEAPMPELPDDSAVHLSDWDFPNETAAKLAGFRAAGDGWLRIDMVERLMRRAHELRGQDKQCDFAVDLPVSLGLSEAEFIALMADGGFQLVERVQAPKPSEAQAEAPATEKVETEKVEPGKTETADAEAVAESETPNPEAAATKEAAEPETPADEAPEAPASSDETEAAGDGSKDETGKTSKFSPDGKSYHYPSDVLRFSWSSPAQFRRGKKSHSAPKGKAGAGKGKGPKSRNPKKAGHGSSNGNGHSPNKNSALADALGEQLASLKKRD